MFLGIDVGARALHVVALEHSLCLIGSTIFTPDRIDELSAFAQDASVIAIDAPSRLSTTPHAADNALSRKFRRARCAEVALGREHRLWVPWVTPRAGDELPEWMRVGLEVHSVLGSAGGRAVEVYPHSAFRVLAGRRPPKKSTPEGIRARARLLRDAGIRSRSLSAWSHDSLDACIAALIAFRVHRGTARPVGCGHDDSAIWLP